MLVADRRPLAEIKADLDQAQILLLASDPEDARSARLLTTYNALCEEMAEQDRWEFCRLLVITQDEHDSEQPFKRFPDEPYTQAIVAWWDRVLKKPSNRVGFIPKSRQMMLSWTAISMVLWSCMFEQGRTIGWQSKKAEDANWMLRRIFGVWERLPDEIKHRHPCEIKEGEIRFPDRGNVVMAVPEGPEKPRQFTWSLFVSDEMAFQAMAEETYVAVQPAIRGGGAYIGISSAAPSFFMSFSTGPDQIIPGSDKILVASKSPLNGVVSSENRSGASVLRVHYSADPKKNDAWVNDFSKTFPGGKEGGPWRAEMEIEADAYGGKRIFPDFTDATHVIKPLDEIPDEWKKYRVIDPGLDHALACCFYVLDPFNEMLIQFDEHIQEGWPEIARHASVIKAKSAKYHFEFTLLDSSAFAKTLAGEGRSVATLFMDNGITVSPASRIDKVQQIAALADLIMLRGPEPRFKVTSNCTISIDMLKKYKWMPQLHDDKESPQKPLKIYDDAVDCSLYLAVAMDVKRASQRARNDDPLQPWYRGSDRRRIMADDRRIQEQLRDWSEEEP